LSHFLRPLKRGFVASLLNFCSCTQDKFVMVVAPALRSAQGARIYTQFKFCTEINFRLRDNLYRDTAPVPATNILYRDSLPAPIKLVPPLLVSLARGRRDTRNAHKNLYPDGKKCAIPSLPAGRQGLHRDPSLRSGLLAKVTGPCPDAASGNTTSPYCRAVSKNAFCGFELASRRTLTNF
jgi:hypothetical protein